MHQSDGMGPELGGQHPVEGGGGATPLEMTEHHRADVATKPGSDLVGHDPADATEPHLPLLA